MSATKATAEVVNSTVSGEKPPVINSDNCRPATRRAGSQRKQTAILCNPSSQASATQLACRCKRIVMQRRTGAACSGTVFCPAKYRLCGRSAAGRSSPLKPYLPNSRKLHKAMGTDPTARLFHRYGHFARYISHYSALTPRLSSRTRTFVCKFHGNNFLSLS